MSRGSCVRSLTSLWYQVPDELAILDVLAARQSPSSVETHRAEASDGPEAEAAAAQVDLQTFLMKSVLLGLQDDPDP